MKIESTLSGERGRLVIAAHDVEKLAGARTFDDVCGMLWGAAAAEASGALGEGRARATAVLTAAWLRTRAGARPLAPDPGRGHAEDFLRMALGTEAHPGHARGLDADLVTAMVGRVAGWCAHDLEQRDTGRLIRPASRYVGPAPAA